MESKALVYLKYTYYFIYMHSNKKRILILQVLSSKNGIMKKK